MFSKKRSTRGLNILHRYLCRTLPEFIQAIGTSTEQWIFKVQDTEYYATCIGNGVYGVFDEGIKVLEITADGITLMPLTKAQYFRLSPERFRFFISWTGMDTYRLGKYLHVQQRHSSMNGVAVKIPAERKVFFPARPASMATAVSVYMDDGSMQFLKPRVIARLRGQEFRGGNWLIVKSQEGWTWDALGNRQYKEVLHVGHLHDGNYTLCLGAGASSSKSQKDLQSRKCLECQATMPDGILMARGLDELFGKKK